MKRYVKCVLQIEKEQNQHRVRARLLLSMSKKVKEALSTWLSGNKIP